MLSAFTNSLKIPELRQRILFTIALIFVCRLISVIPVPGVDAEALRTIMDRMAAQGGDIGFMGLLDLFSGGAVRLRLLLRSFLFHVLMQFHRFAFQRQRLLCRAFLIACRLSEIFQRDTFSFLFFM